MGEESGYRHASGHRRHQPAYTDTNMDDLSKQLDELNRNATCGMTSGCCKFLQFLAFVAIGTTLVLSIGLVIVASDVSDDVDELEVLLMDMCELLMFIADNTFEDPVMPARGIEGVQEVLRKRAVDKEGGNVERIKSLSPEEVTQLRTTLMDTIDRARGGRKQARVNQQTERETTFTSSRIHAETSVSGPPDPSILAGGVAHMLSDFYNDNQHRVYCYEEDDIIPNTAPDTDDAEGIADYFRNVTLACTVKHIAYQLELINSALCPCQ